MIVLCDEGEIQNQIIFKVYLKKTMIYLRWLTTEEILQLINLALDYHWDWLNVIDLKTNFFLWEQCSTK